MTDQLEDIVTIPLETLQTEQGDDVVYLDHDGERKRRKVSVAFRTPSEAVISQGLKEGDRVIIPSLTKNPSQR